MTREEAIRIAQGLITDFKCESETMVDFCNTVIKALEQESKTWSLDDAREDFMSDVYDTLDFLPTNDEANRIIDSFDRVTSGIKKESKTGYWNTYEITQGGINEEWIEYSECMWSNALVIPRNYCPNCGCKMEVIGDDNRRSN